MFSVFLILTLETKLIMSNCTVKIPANEFVLDAFSRDQLRSIAKKVNVPQGRTKWDLMQNIASTGKVTVKSQLYYNK